MPTKVAPPIYVVDVIGEVVAAVNAKIYPPGTTSILYKYGRSPHILKELQARTQSPTYKGKQFPLIALYQDFPEDFGVTAYYGTTTIPKIIIACLTREDNYVSDRYPLTFKPILYPIYYEFLRQLVAHKNIIGNDPGAVLHRKWDRPGHEKSQGILEVVDAIEINNLQLTLRQIKTC